MSTNKGSEDIIRQVAWLVEEIESFLQKHFIENKIDVSMKKEDLDKCCEDIFRKSLKMCSNFLKDYQNSEESSAALHASVEYIFRNPDRLSRSFSGVIAHFVKDKKEASFHSSLSELETLDDRLTINTAKIQALKGVVSRKGDCVLTGQEVSQITEEFLKLRVLGMAEEILTVLEVSPTSNPKRISPK